MMYGRRRRRFVRRRMMMYPMIGPRRRMFLRPRLLWWGWFPLGIGGLFLLLMIIAALLR